MSTSYDQYIRFFAGQRLYFLGSIFAFLLWLALTLLHLALEPHSATVLHMVADFLVLQAVAWLLSSWVVRQTQRCAGRIAVENARLYRRSEKLYRRSEKLAVLQERERFGRELHDGVIQSIYAVGLTVEDCQQRIESEPQLVHARLGQIMAGLNSVIMDIRSYILDLRPRTEQPERIGARLAQLTDAMFSESNIEVRLETDPLDPGLLSSAQAMETLRIAQEALLNVQRHALATEIVVRLHFVDGMVHLQIEDNGVGFMPEAVVLSGGLHNMQERAQLLEGQLKIQSVGGQGTCVHLCFAP
ncbi:hypothetical protein GC175_28185 [bacterium]|nr:hypothetical protein [bacterium]